MEYTCELCGRTADTNKQSDLDKARETSEVIEGYSFVENFCWGCGARFTEEEAAELKAEAMEVSDV
jgi:hypothetical protein